MDAANAHARLAALPAVPQNERRVSSGGSSTASDDLASETRVDGDAGHASSEVSSIMSRLGLLDDGAVDSVPAAPAAPAS